MPGNEAFFSRVCSARRQRPSTRGRECPELRLGGARMKGAGEGKNKLSPMRPELPDASAAEDWSSRHAPKEAWIHGLGRHFLRGSLSFARSLNASCATPSHRYRTATFLGYN